MLYKKNQLNNLTQELFQNPTAEYRGTPFWAWNCELKSEQLLRQIDYLKEMGLGGFHMHPRTGLGTKYLADDYMGHIKECVEKAEKEEMLAWLYDEDRWPSGAAGGIVTKNPKYRSRFVLFTPVPYGNKVLTGVNIAAARATRAENGYLLACYDIALNDDGCLKSYKKIDEKQEATGIKWYAYVETPLPDPWYNGQTYVNTLDKEAMQEFIKVTYDAYKTAVGEYFGTVVPAIFTDEPQFTHKTTLNFATDKMDVYLPWSDDLADTFAMEYKNDVVAKFPELIWDLSDKKISQVRYQYHDHISERFAQAFADQCGGWCEKNNLMLTGHMMEEPTLRSQTAALGDAMRSYRSFQLPGIDMLCDNTEFTTAKQAQSATHQYGREGVLSELYGVTGWDFDFRGHKFQGDWQAALGVTVRVQHLSWVSMAGEAKRDYPASINYQSPWYKEYSFVENHFARVNTALTRGKPIVKIGVIHPVESYWLYWGPKENTAQIRSQLDESFENVTNWLLFGAQDFDFISESLLPSQCEVAKSPLKVGEMEYDTIVVPNCHTLRSSTLKRLNDFKKQGGKLIFVGSCPTHVDAVESDEVKALYQASITVNVDRSALLTALQPQAEIEIRNADGSKTENLLYQYREDNDCRWLFIAHGTKLPAQDAIQSQDIVIRIKGSFTPTFYDTITGEIYDINYKVKNGYTTIRAKLNIVDTILMKLSSAVQSDIIVSDSREIGQLDITDNDGFGIMKKVSYKRLEPNVCIFDLAEYKLDNEEYQPLEEILRLDNILRKRCGYPLRSDAVAQPWVLEKKPIEHCVTLRFAVDSQINVSGAKLALENAENAEISINGVKVENEIDGYFTDESINTVKLPDICKGENIFEIKLPFAERENIEAIYLLGEFNVMVEGCVKSLTAPTKEIGFGDIVRQGMPFYGGNIQYYFDIDVPAENSTVEIKTSYFRGAAVTVDIDGKRAGINAYAPYITAIKGVSKGKHKLAITLLGNRYNSFGALHCSDSLISWHGPSAWRTTDNQWSYDYVLKPTGLLKSPVIKITTN